MVFNSYGFRLFYTFTHLSTVATVTHTCPFTHLSFTYLSFHTPVLSHTWLHALVQVSRTCPFTHLGFTSLTLLPTEVTETDVESQSDIPSTPPITSIRLKLLYSTHNVHDAIHLDAGTILTSTHYDPASEWVWCQCEANPDIQGYLPTNYLQKL